MSFVAMATVIPESPVPEVNGFYIQHRSHTEAEIAAITQEAYRRDHLNLLGLLPDVVYCSLREKVLGRVITWMSDTPFEQVTNEHVLNDAAGDVFIAGLGIGMLPYALCQKEDIRSVTVVEIEPQVIALVGPHIVHPKLRIIEGDARTPSVAGRAFDFIYLDIWPMIDPKNWPDMQMLLEMYREFLRPEGTIRAWLQQPMQMNYQTVKGTT